MLLKVYINYKLKCINKKRPPVSREADYVHIAISVIEIVSCFHGIAYTLQS